MRCLIILAGLARVGSNAIAGLKKNFIDCNRGWEFDVFFHAQKFNPDDMPDHDPHGTWAGKYISRNSAYDDLMQNYKDIGAIRGVIIKDYDTSALEWRGMVLMHRFMEALDYIGVAVESSKTTKVPCGFQNYDKVLCIRVDAVLLSPLILGKDKAFTHLEESNKRPATHSDIDYGFMSDPKAAKEFLVRHNGGVWHEVKEDLHNSFDERMRYRFKSVDSFKEDWTRSFSGFHQYLANNGYFIGCHASKLDRYLDPRPQQPWEVAQDIKRRYDNNQIERIKDLL